MKILICLFGLALSLTCCKSQEKVTGRSDDFSAKLTEVFVKEDIRDSVFVENITPEPPIPLESVTTTQGKIPLHYCVIVGSFMYPRNAISLRNKLMLQGFSDASIYRNTAGMYRVSVLCEDSHEAAWEDVCRIRSEYPQYHDAWLLETKD